MLYSISPFSLYTTILINQGVFTYLIDNLGVKDVQFEELISLDPSELQQLRYHLCALLIKSIYLSLTY